MSGSSQKPSWVSEANPSSAKPLKRLLLSVGLVIVGLDARSMLMAAPVNDKPLRINVSCLIVGLEAVMRMPDDEQSRIVELLIVSGPAVTIAPAAFSPAKRMSTWSITLGVPGRGKKLIDSHGVGLPWEEPLLLVSLSSAVP